MLDTDIEGDWLASLDDENKALFLASLGHELTIAGRHTYAAQEEGLDKPAQLRRINEIQHRVWACLHEILEGTPNIEFQKSIVSWVLPQPDQELEGMMIECWNRAKRRITCVSLNS